MMYWQAAFPRPPFENGSRGYGHQTESEHLLTDILAARNCVRQPSWVGTADNVVGIHTTAYACSLRRGATNPSAVLVERVLNVGAATALPRRVGLLQRGA